MAGTVAVAFFRGVNVGGHGIIKMATVPPLFEALGFADAKTHIASGNVVFRAPGTDTAAMERKIAAAVTKTYGFAAKVIVVTLADLKKAMSANPLKAAEKQPNRLLLYFLAAKPQRHRLGALSALAVEGESLALVGKVLYLHLPHGIARSKLAVGVERALGIPATARNWNTVCKMVVLGTALTAA